jgi:hypothetical protein
MALGIIPTCRRREKVALQANPEAADKDQRPFWEKLLPAPFGISSNEIKQAPGPNLGDVFALVGTIGKAAVWIADPHNWLRVVEVLLGAALVLAGLWRLSPDTAGAVKSVAKKASLAVAVA